jgi:hypothetical protein
VALVFNFLLSATFPEQPPGFGERRPCPSADHQILKNYIDIFAA